MKYKASSPIAAYEWRTQVSPEDVREAAHMALLHRQRRQPFQQPHLVTEQLDTMVEQFQNQSSQREPSDQGSNSNQDQDDGESDQSNRDEPPEDSGPQDQLFEVGTPFSIRSLQVQPPDRRARTSGGRRANTISGTATGHYIGAKIPEAKASDLALDATLRAAAPHQQQRRGEQFAPDSPPLLKGGQGGFLPAFLL